MSRSRQSNKSDNDKDRYLITDFERSNFSIFPNSWTPNAEPQLISITAVSPPPPPPTTTPTSSKLAGITVGAISFFLLGIGLALDFLRRKRALKTSTKKKSNDTVEDMHPVHAKPEMDGSGNEYREVDGSSLPPAEVDSIIPIEMQGDVDSGPISSARYPSELEGNKRVAELEGTLGSLQVGRGKELPKPKGDSASTLSPKPA